MYEKYIICKPRNFNTPYINADNIVDLVKQKKKENLDEQIATRKIKVLIFLLTEKTGL
jgi:hypothetical protein